MSFTEGNGGGLRYEPSTLWALCKRHEISRLHREMSFFQGTGDTHPLMLRIRMDTVQYGSRYGSRYGSSPVQYGSVPTLSSAGTSPAAEFKELRSCPPREKEPVQPWEGDALDVDIALILFLQLVCSGGFFLNLLDRLVTLLLRAARFEAN